MDTPITSAKRIFEESLTSLMAHTIRGVVAHFRKNQIELNVRVIADTVDAIQLQEPNRGATSILASKLVKKQVAWELDRVYARIFVHQFANKHLARICIAHEIYHLLLELHGYISTNRSTWAAIPVSKQTEDACNQFAWELCRRHDLFNKSKAAVEAHVHFPDRLFETVLKTSDTGNSLQWPKGIEIDRNNPFHAMPNLELLDPVFEALKS